MKPRSPAGIGLPSRTPRSRDGLSLDQALGRSVPLARLSERLRDSSARFAAIRPELPDGLVAHVAAGPVDEAGWTLLVANAAVAAKLRQLEPRIEERLLQQGWAPTKLRIRILPGAG